LVRKIVTLVILVPLAIVIVAFAVANRALVTVIFDPFDQTNPAYSATLPLFVLIFVLVLFGMIVGWFATWLRHGRWRRAARRLEAELHSLRQRHAVETQQSVSPPSPPPRTPPLSIPPPT
jgi:uncharacterized integral membrane protein